MKRRAFSDFSLKDFTKALRLRPNIHISSMIIMVSDFQSSGVSFLRFFLEGDGLPEEHLRQELETSRHIWLDELQVEEVEDVSSPG